MAEYTRADIEATAREYPLYKINELIGYLQAVRDEALAMAENQFIE